MSCHYNYNITLSFNFFSAEPGQVKQIDKQTNKQTNRKYFDCEVKMDALIAASRVRQCASLKFHICDCTAGNWGNAMVKMWI